MTYNDYAQIDAVNQSRLKHIAESPAHYKAKLEEGDGDTDARIMGRYFHALALDPVDALTGFVRWTDGRRASKAWDAFKEQHADRNIIPYATPAQKNQCERYEAMANAVQRHPYVLALLNTPGAQTEATFTGNDPVTGRLIKCRADLVKPTTDGFWYDLKGVNTTNARQFGAMAYRNRWIHQAAFNRRCILAQHGEAPSTYGFIVVEDRAPYDVAIFDVPTDMMELADNEVTEWLRLLESCEASGEWPGRQSVAGECPQLLDVPAYAFGGTDPELYLED